MHRLLLTLAFLRNNKALAASIAALAVFIILSLVSFARIETLMIDAGSHEEQLAVLNTRIEHFGDITERNDRLVEENAELKAENADIDANNNRLTAENKKLGSENDELTAANDELERLNGDLSKKYDGLSKPN